MVVVPSGVHMCRAGGEELGGRAGGAQVLGGLGGWGWGVWADLRKSRVVWAPRKQKAVLSKA